MPWNPNRYEEFKEARSAPFDDLVALIEPHPGLKVIDLGCGTGELTRRLADMLPDSTVLGIDNSPEMLERAQLHERPGLHFECGAMRRTSVPSRMGWRLFCGGFGGPCRQNVGGAATRDRG